MTESPPIPAKPDSRPESRPAKAAVPPTEDFIFVDAGWKLRQLYRRDPLQVPFLNGLRRKTLLGVRDTKSNRVLFPPRSFSEETYTDLTELVPVGPGGIIRSLARLPGGGRDKRPPSLIVFVQLDGTDCAAASPLRGAGADIAVPIDLIGRRCRAVFRDQPAGDWNDYWFELEG